MSWPTWPSLSPRYRIRWLTIWRPCWCKRATGGLDVDFEYVYAEDAGAYAAFLGASQSGSIPLGYPVIAALAPKIAADQPGTLYEGPRLPPPSVRQSIRYSL